MTLDELRLFVLEHAPSHVLLADLVSAGAEIERLKAELDIEKSRNDQVTKAIAEAARSMGTDPDGLDDLSVLAVIASRAARLRSNRLGLRFVTRARRLQVLELRERAERAELALRAVRLFVEEGIEADTPAGNRQRMRCAMSIIAEALNPGLDAAPAGEGDAT